jgi:hypothetical protein
MWVGWIPPFVCDRKNPPKVLQISYGREAVFNHRYLAECWLVRSEPRFLVWNRTSSKLQIHGNGKNKKKSKKKRSRSRCSTRAIDLSK